MVDLTEWSSTIAVRDVLAQDFIRKQYTAMNANWPFVIAGKSILTANTKSFCENMDVAGMLPNLDNLYFVRCFQKCKKNWGVQAGMQLCPVVVAQVSTSTLLECSHLGEKKQKKTERKYKKPGVLFLLVNQSISLCLIDCKTTTNKAVKECIWKFLKCYSLSWVSIFKHIHAYLVKSI